MSQKLREALQAVVDSWDLDEAREIAKAALSYKSLTSQAAALLGSIKSEAKAKAARENGKNYGRGHFSQKRRQKHLASK